MRAARAQPFLASICLPGGSGPRWTCLHAFLKVAGLVQAPPARLVSMPSPTSGNEDGEEKARSRARLGRARRWVDFPSFAGRATHPVLGERHTKAVVRFPPRRYPPTHPGWRGPLAGFQGGGVPWAVAGICVVSSACGCIMPCRVDMNRHTREWQASIRVAGNKLGRPGDWKHQQIPHTGGVVLVRNNSHAHPGQRRTHEDGAQPRNKP